LVTDSKIAIVTGAGGDIGRAISAALRAPGTIVLACDIDAVAAEATARQLNTPELEVIATQCDVTDPTSVAALAATAKARGTVSILVNNAGGITASSLHAADAEGFRHDLALNLEAAFVCFKAFEGDLKATGGAVVNIASVNGFGVFGHPGYSAAKAGLIHLTRMIAVEYGKYGIRANAVAPGSVRTQAWDARAGENPGIFDEVKRFYPLGRIARTEDVAAAVAFLVSPAAVAITGVCLPVDCGLTAGQAELAAAFSQSSDY
jgi:NAD(P)-dependent dehydrogenase (short-subunit alcohol dehydrogenase family)